MDPSRLFRPVAPVAALALLGLGGVVVAQDNVIEGGATPGTAAHEAPAQAATQRVVEANDDSGILEIGGINVDVVAKSATAARFQGWRIAQRKGWELLAKRYGREGGLPDGTLDSIVSGIVIEHEEAGANRYIARLGVQFSRGRAGALLGIPADQARSAPMLVVPVVWTGGAGQTFEQKTPWADAWARFRTGSSTIDYVRPAGTGPDSLLLNSGQALRPGRGWWRTILGQYGASNVLIPVVHLYRQWPGGPIIGTFQARYGPDNRLLGSFSLRVADGEQLPALLDAGVKRIDEIYQRAMAADVFRVDPGLAYRPPEPVVTEQPTDDGSVLENIVEQAGAQAIMVQFDTPNAGAVTSAEAALRGVPGVRSAVTTSLALGGISVMRVTYGGDINGLATALEQRGWRVGRGNGAIRIERPGGAPSTDVKTGG